LIKIKLHVALFLSYSHGWATKTANCKPHGFIELTKKPDSNLKGYLKEMSMLQCDMAHHVLSYLCSANWADL
jgi:hypothetical protein